ncbi:MAG: hypothetical protein K2L39_01620 [Muribaculaceae bacterium]|nr:hypothetical protein [Muribaculaceae bacterium]
MTETLSLNQEHRDSLSPGAQSAAPRGKVYFSVSAQEWIWNLIFMLSLSLTGLAMPLGNLLVVILLIRAFKVNREAFVFMLMLTLGGYAMSEPKYQWGVNHMFYMFPVAILSMCVLKKSLPVKQTIIAYGAFAAFTVVMCVLYGGESMYTQLRPMLFYLSFCFFALPLVSFSGEGFDMHRFWNTAFSFMMIMCAFYIIDGYIIRGWVLVPCSWINYEGTLSTWNAPVAYGPFGWTPRKYPPGLYPFALLLYPMAKYYRLKWWQWALIAGAMCASRTSTILFSLVVGFILAQGSFKRYVIYGILAVSAFVGLYYVDDAMGYSSETEQSTMRIASTINQFFDLSEAQDDEDLAEAGTGRMAQVIPSVEYTFSVGREWVGFGFVDPDTKIPSLIVENELVANPEFKYQAVNNVEVTQVKEFLTQGFIGLAVWFAFIFGICRILRGMRYARYYTNVAIVLMLYGIGGFDSWFNFPGILIGAMAFASVLLANKPQSLEEYPREEPA